MNTQILEDADLAGFYVSSGFVMSSHNGHFTVEIEKFAELTKARAIAEMQQAQIPSEVKAYIERLEAALQVCIPLARYGLVGTKDIEQKAFQDAIHIALAAKPAILKD